MQARAELAAAADVWISSEQAGDVMLCAAAAAAIRARQQRLVFVRIGGA